MANENMNDKAPMWRWRHVAEIVGVIVAIVALVVTVYMYFFATPGARLEFQLISESVLVKAPDSSRSSGVTILFNGAKVESVSLVSIGVENTGSANLIPLDETIIDEKLRSEKPGDEATDREKTLSPVIWIKSTGTARILETSFKVVGDDKSTRALQCIQSSGDCRYDILLMNADARAQIDVLVEGLDVADDLEVFATGAGLQSTFKRSPSAWDTLISSPMPAILIIVSVCAMVYSLVRLRRARRAMRKVAWLSSAVTELIGIPTWPQLVDWSKVAMVYHAEGFRDPAPSFETREKAVAWTMHAMKRRMPIEKIGEQLEAKLAAQDKPAEVKTIIACAALGLGTPPRPKV